MATIKFKHSEYSSSNVIALAIRTIDNLKWKVSVYSENDLTATINHSEYQSDYSQLRIIIKNDEVTLICNNDMVLITNEARNKEYLNKFFRTYESIRLSISNRELEKISNKIINVPPPLINFYKVDSFKSFTQIFIPSKLFLVTTIILDINILLYVIMSVSSGIYIIDFHPETLIAAGANYKTAILSGEWYRLLTSIFLHSNLPHLLLNMVMLFYTGTILEPVIGKLKFALVYVLTGVFANLISVYFTNYTLTVGASGAIFGLLGVFLGLATGERTHSELRKLIIFIVIAITISTTVNGFLKGGINHVAHFAGLFFGAILTIIYLQIQKRKSRQKFSINH